MTKEAWKWAAVWILQITAFGAAEFFVSYKVGGKIAENLEL